MRRFLRQAGSLLFWHLGRMATLCQQWAHLATLLDSGRGFTADETVGDLWSPSACACSLQRAL